jgi:hypothetical protein
LGGIFVLFDAEQSFVAKGIFEGQQSCGETHFPYKFLGLFRADFGIRNFASFIYKKTIYNRILINKYWAY